jgi:hypothetical protein
MTIPKTMLLRLDFRLGFYLYAAKLGLNDQLIALQMGAFEGRSISWRGSSVG